MRQYKDSPFVLGNWERYEIYAYFLIFKGTPYNVLARAGPSFVESHYAVTSNNVTIICSSFLFLSSQNIFRFCNLFVAIRREKVVLLYKD